MTSKPQNSDDSMIAGPGRFCLIRIETSLGRTGRSIVVPSPLNVNQPHPGNHVSHPLYSTKNLAIINSHRPDWRLKGTYHSMVANSSELHCSIDPGSTRNVMISSWKRFFVDLDRRSPTELINSHRGKSGKPHAINNLSRSEWAPIFEL